MSRRERVEDFFSKAEELERKYDWVKATDLYEQALGAVEKRDFSKKGKIQEKIGYCFYRAAFQAESRGEFRRHMQLAVEAYEKATELFKRVEEAKRSSAKILHCRAMVAYIGHWLSLGPDTKRELLDECWRLEKEALKAYDEAGDRLGFGETCVGLANCLADRLDLELDTRMREKILDEALSHGEKAIRIFSKAGDQHELARAYCITSILYFNAALSLQLETKRGEYEQKVFNCAKEAIRISEKTGDKLLLGRSTVCLGFAERDLGAGSEASFELFRKAVQYGIETKDHRIVSEAFDGLAYSTWWSMILEEDPEKIREKSKQCEEYTSEAISCSILADYGLGIPHSYSLYVQNFGELARREIKLETRHKLLKKAVALGKQGLEHAQRTGSTHAIFHVSYGLVQALYYLSTMKTGVEKRQLLEEAMTLGEKVVYYAEQLRPDFVMPQAWSYDALALILFELGKLEESREKRKKLFEKAVSRMEDGITILQRYVTSFSSRRELFAWLSRFHAELGNILNQLYQTTSEREVLRKLIEAYQSAVQMNKKADLVSRVAEAHWQIAKTYNQLAEYPESAKNFEAASKNYRLAAEKMPQLKGFYMDYALYMQAWSEIEKARNGHVKEEYGKAKEHYEKTANLHKSTERWNYLCPNYFAWARLEEAEDLSRREQTKEAKDLFQQAAKLFAEAKKSIKAKLEKIEVRDEREMAAGLIKASHIRREYCLGRIALEEAKLLDRQGDHLTSSKKYGLAAETFQKMAKVETEPSRKELQPIIYLCQAWQMMTQAEAEASPNLYLEASQLFDEVKEHSFDEKAKVLALGHSRFCKALEAGTRFEETGDMTIYSTTKKHMEAAANYYLKAGFKNASEYAKATLRLFDAYMYMDKAETETEPRKKAQYYQIVEKLLQASAGSFKKAKHPEKSEEVGRLLESVEEERRLAMSLTEVLHAPAIASTTTSFSTLTPTHEKAVGLERFEHADIQAHLAASEEVTVGEELDVRLDLVNVAKNFGLLVRVDDLVSPGFKVTALPSQYSMENGSIDMRGKRLEPLKVESIKLRLQATKAGVISLNPQVIYVDEVGKFRTCWSEPVSITVHPKLIFEFKTKAAQSVFDFLTNSFVEDYMRRRISLEKSGWRTLMQIVKHGKVSKSSVYGAGGRRGRAISELERRGLVEERVFPGERGRGGRILKMRISYEKETIKRYIDQRVMKIKEK